MRGSLHVRVMLVIGPTLIAAAVVLGLVLSRQTVSHFVVYLSSQEQLEQLAPDDQLLLRFYASRIAAMIVTGDGDEIKRIVDIMAGATGREIVTTRNDELFIASRRLRAMETRFAVTAAGRLTAHIRSPNREIVTDVELSPVVTQEITPFVIGSDRSSDVMRIYAIPPLALRPAVSEERFVSQATRTIALLTGVTAAVMIVLIGVVLATSLSPVRRLTAAAHALRLGRSPRPVRVGGPPEVRELADAFNEMARTIEATEASRRRMLADISHELRGPLSNLRTQIEAVRDGLLPADARTVESLAEDAMLLSRLVEDLHELTLADSRELRLDPGPVAPRGLVSAAVAPLRAAFEGSDTAITIDVPHDLPPVVADAQRMVQVVRNVLENALRYATGTTVRVSAATEGAFVVLRLADTGSGVESDDLERIFDRFYRPDLSRARASGGSGLGLAIARALVEAQGGSIHAEPNHPHGLVVSIVLPTAEVTSPPAK